MTVFSLGHPPLGISVFGMGLPELAVIGVIAVVVFGPKKLPELGSSIGKALRGFKDEMSNATSSDQTPEPETPEAEPAQLKEEKTQADKAA